MFSSRISIQDNAWHSLARKYILGLFLMSPSPVERGNVMSRCLPAMARVVCSLQRFSVQVACTRIPICSELEEVLRFLGCVLQTWYECFFHHYIKQYNILQAGDNNPSNEIKVSSHLILFSKYEIVVACVHCEYDKSSHLVMYYSLCYSVESCVSRLYAV